VLNGKETVLLVEDEPKVLDICERFLRNLGYSILTAMTGWEALQTYERNKANIDIVVLDMILPGMGGSELFDALKAMGPDLRVLISTGYSVEGEVSDLLKRGCRGCIQKPFSMRVLAKEIRRLLDEK
jgi:CheY-like chemotaxis protein